MKRDVLTMSDFNLSQNQTGELGRIGVYTVNEWDGLQPDPTRPYSLFLATLYQETGTDLATPDSYDIDVTDDIPNVPGVPDDGGIAVVDWSGDSFTTINRATISSINYFDAGSNPNRITIDSSGISEASADINAYHLFKVGKLKMVAVPTEAMGTAEVEIDENNLGALTAVDPTKKSTAFSYEKPQQLIDGWKFVLKLNSSVKVSWNQPGGNYYPQFLRLPVIYKDESELPSKEQLKRQLLDNLVKA